MPLLLICTVLFISPLVFFRYCKDAFSAPKNIIVFVLLAVIFLYMVFKYLAGKVKLSIKPSLFFAFFILVAIFSSSYSVNFMVSFRWALEMLLYFGLFLAVVDITAEKKNVLFGLLNVALVSGLAVTLTGIMQFFHIDLVFRVTDFAGRISSTLGNANFLGGYLILLVPVSLAMFFIVEKWYFKLLYAVNTILLLAALFFTQTLNAWIGLALGLTLFFVLFMIFIKKYRIVMLVSAAAIVLAGSALTLAFKPEEALGKLNKLGQLETFAERGRWLMWKSALEMIKDRPLAGFGAGTYRLKFTEYEAKLLQTPEFYKYPHIITKDAHNDYLQIGAELGIPGLLFLLLLVGTAITGALKTLPREKLEIQIITIGLLAALVSFLVHMFFNFPLKLSPTAALFFVYLGLLSSGYGIVEFGPARKIMRSLFAAFVIVFAVVVLLIETFVFWANFKIGRAIEISSKGSPGAALIAAQDSLFFSDTAGSTVDLRSHFYLGEIYYKLQNYKSAEEEFKKEVEQNPFYPDARYNLGLIQEINGKYEEACASYEKVLSIDKFFEGVAEKIERVKKRKGKAQNTNHK